MNLDETFQLLYTHWSFFILIIYVTGGLTYLIYRAFPTFNAAAIKLFILTLTVLIVLFYFVIPVPVKVQDDFLQNLQNMKRNNKEFKDTYIQLTKLDVCKNKYLNAYGFFAIKNSFVNDQEIAFQKQRNLYFTPFEHNSKSYKYICNQ